MKTTIWWIRRDIRLADNQALQHALAQTDQLIPLFILDPNLLKHDAPFRKAFLFNSLTALANELEKQNCPLIIRRGQPLQELQRLHTETNADMITAEQDYSPYALRRDRSIAEKLPLTLTDGLTIYPPGAATKSDCSTYTVFTPFSRQWKGLPKPGFPSPAPPMLPTHPDLSGESVPDAAPIAGFPAGEHIAQQRIHDFLFNKLCDYHTTRDRMDLDGTSMLSPYIRFGIISIRDIYAQLMDFLVAHKDQATCAGGDKWVNEIIWREFYINIMAAFPHVLQTAFRENLRKISWRNDPLEIEAWQSGLTGYPVVDAGMRQLAETGWMHNRARMITASFLTKDLLVNWQIGEAWFMRQLIDGDPASNNGGWQWTAGTGTDAAAYFRVFNPVTQSKKFDPSADYIRRWVPELSPVPDRYIHAPWMMPLDVQSACGVHIGSTYPAPIVEHAFARERALAAYKQSKLST